MASPYTYSVGKRKTAIARVKLFQGGSGELKVNDKAAKTYFTPLQIEKLPFCPVRTRGANRFSI